MSGRRAPWCCAAFGRAFEREERGFFVTGRRLQDGVMFVIAFRASATEAASLESEIAFCPWCGARLAKYYADRLDLLANVQ